MPGSKILSTISVILISIVCYGQKIIHYPLIENNDTIYALKHHTKQRLELQLPDLIKDSALNGFRFWFQGSTLGHVVEIYENKKGTLTGGLIIYTKEVVSNNEAPTNRIFARKTVIPDDICRQILSKYKKFHVDTLPDQHQIKGWGQGYDGETYLFEQGAKTDYYFKTYWSPKAQDHLPEAENVLAFIDAIDKLLHTSVLIKEFNAKVPFATCTLGGAYASIIAKNSEERNERKLERMRFRKLYAIGKAQLLDKNW
jgi:hypothetical protein